MAIPEQLEAQAAELERCAEALAELIRTVCRRAKDVGDVEAALKRYRVDLDATWKGLAQVGFDQEWGGAAFEMDQAVSGLYGKAKDLGGDCKCLHDQATDLRQQAAHIRQQQE